MSILTIYQTHLTPERNALVDELDWYLENEALQRFKFENFQYQQLGLELTITIPIDQENITNQTVGNYLTITQDGKTWYYFIMSYNWTSVKAITIQAALDSVNTFRNDVEWSRKTTINRQHEDRFAISENLALNRKIDVMDEGIETTKHLIEDTKLQQSTDELDWFLVYRTQSDEGVVAEENIPFDTFLCASQPIVLSIEQEPTAELQITPSVLQTNYEYILGKDNPVAVLNLPSQVARGVYENRDIRINDRIILAGYYPVTFQGRTLITYEVTVKNIVLKKSNDEIQWYINWSNPVVKTIGTEYHVNPWDVQFDLSDTTSYVLFTATDHLPSKMPQNNDDTLFHISYDSSPSITAKILHKTRAVSDDVAIQEVIAGDYPIHEYNVGSFATNAISSFEEVDRTMKPLMKVLRLPYAPMSITYREEDGVYSIPANWIPTTFPQIDNSLTLLELQKEFFTEGFLSSVGSIDIDDYLLYNPDIEQRLSNSARNMKAESKLFSSEFLTLKFIYDSFSSAVNLEQFQPESGGLYVQKWTLPVRFKPTNTTASTFLFDLGFDQLHLCNPSINLNYKQFQDYEQYLLVNRNNEEALYSSDYLDYMRYGYNYDKKTTDENIAQGWINATLGAIAGGGQAVVAGQHAHYSRLAQNPLDSAAASAILKNPYRSTPSQTQSAAKVKLGQLGFGAGFLISQAIQTGAAALNGMINQAIATKQAYRGLEQKKYELQQQTVGVQGANDIDLLKYYNDNKLHFIVYDTIDLQKEAAYNLFHYCGYNRAKQAVPNFTGRYWFNFIQCSPRFKNEELHPYNDFLDNIKARYETGITVYHRHYNSAGPKQSYDWEQEFENWENDIVYQKYTTDMISAIATAYKQTIIYRGPTLDNYYAWIEVEDADGNSLLNTKDTEGEIPYDTRWEFTNAARVRINTRQWEQQSDWCSLGG